MNIRAKLFHMLFPKEEHLLAEREAMLAKIRKDKRVLQNIVNSQNERCGELQRKISQMETKNFHFQLSKHKAQDKRCEDLQRKIEQIEKECKHNIEIAKSYKAFFEKAGRILNKSK